MQDNADPRMSDKHAQCTLGNGTSHFPAFSFRFCFTVLLSTLALSTYGSKTQVKNMQPMQNFDCTLFWLTLLWPLRNEHMMTSVALA